MAGGVQHISTHLTNVKCRSVHKEGVKLGTVAFKLGAFVEDFAKSILNNLDIVADTDLSANPFLKVRGS